MPLFPSFITLTNVAFPGVSLVPCRWFARADCRDARAGASSLPIGMLRATALRAGAVAADAALVAACLVSLALGFNLRDGSVFVLIFALAVLWHAHIDRYYGDRAGMSCGRFGGRTCSPARSRASRRLLMVVTRIPADLYTHRQRPRGRNVCLAG